MGGVQMNEDLASLVTQITPYISAAVGAYGGAVLVRARDEAADATVRLGRRLLLRIFGSRSRGDPLPEPLQDLAADPQDADALASLRLAVRKELGRDSALADDVRSMVIAAGVVIQQVSAGRDVHTAGRDQTTIYINSGQMPDRMTILPRYQLLADSQFFTGRKDELDRLRRAIATPSGLLSSAVAIYAIDGAAGVGKTALVVHLAHELASRYEDGQLFLDLQAYTANATALEPAVALSRLLAALGVQGSLIPESLEERASLWRDMLRGRRVLVVLDNALNYGQVKPLLPGASESLVLITSRNRMISRGKLPSVRLGVLTPSEAIALFTKIVNSDRAIAQGKDLPCAIAEDDEAVAGVVASCGYLPLAIELAANQLVMHPAWSASDLADDLADSFRADNANAVEAVLALSYRDLEPELKRTFRFLGLHPGLIITPADVAALADCTVAQATQMLEDLYRIHLVEDLPYGVHRYRIHDLVRDYAARLVGEEDSEAERSGALGRLIDAYLYYATAVDEWLRCLNHRSIDITLRPPEGIHINSFSEALAWMDEAYPNVIACANRAQDIAMCPHAWRIPEMLAYFLRIRGHLHEASDLHSAALKSAQNHKDLLGQATALYNLGIIDRITGNADGARDRLGGALRAYSALNDLLGQAETLRAMGILDRLTGDYGNAKEQLDRAFALHLVLGNRLGEAWVLGAQGILNRLTGWFISARDCFERALGILSELGDKLGEAWMLNELGSLDRLTGRYNNAQTRLARAIELFLDLGDQFSQAWAMCQLAVIDRLIGEYASAHERFDSSLGIVRSLRNQFAEARILCELSILDRLDSNYVTARSRLNGALKIYRVIGDSLGEAWALCELAVLDGMTRGYASTGSRLGGGLAIYRDLGERLGEAWTLNALGVVDRLTGNFPDSQSGMDHMLAAYRSLGNPLGEAWTLSTLGVLGRIVGDYRGARTKLQDALEVHDRLDNRPGKAWTLGILGILDGLTLDYPTAYDRLKAATIMYRHLGNRLGEAWTTKELAILDIKTATYGSAGARLDEVRKIYTSIGDRLGIAETLLEIAELSENTGRSAEARGLWEQAARIFEELGLAADASYVRPRF